MNAIFVDTSGWFALAARRGRDYPKALNFFQRSRSPLLTTDYIVNETVQSFQDIEPIIFSVISVSSVVKIEFGTIL